MRKPVNGNNKQWLMRWIMLFLIVDANIFAMATFYRVFLPPVEEISVEDTPIDQTALALHRDHIILEQHQITISKQLNRCLYWAL